jgi:hypothetical protein
MLFVTAPASVQAQTEEESCLRMDFSGMDHFWEITETLKQNQRPSGAQWEAFFDTPGYRALAEWGWGPRIRKRMRLAFMPSKQEARADTLESDGRALRKYRRVTTRESDLHQVQSELQSRDRAMLEEAFDLASEFLPEGASARCQAPPVAFVIFGSGGRGSSEAVVVNLLSFSKRTGPKQQEQYLAHELHHAFREHIVEVPLPEREDPAWNMLQAISQLETEGVADQIDKEPLLRDVESYPARYKSRAKGYQKYVANAPERLRRVDSLTQAIAEAPSMIEEDGEAILKTLPLSGHPDGYYMAEVIEEQYGREALIETVGHPFDFLRRYNRAAKQSGEEHYTFSEKAMGFFETLEQKYTQK